MATFQDFIITVFSTYGLRDVEKEFREYEQRLRDSSRAVLGLAASASGLGRAMYPVFFAFYNSHPHVQLLASRLMILHGVIRAVTTEFAKAERAQFQFQLTMAHSGFPEATADLMRYAKARQLATGIDETATMQLAEQLTNLRFTQDQVRALIPALQNAAAAGHGSGAGGAGGSVEQGAANIAKSIAMGETAALLNMGLDVEKIRRSADQTSEIIRQLTMKFGGNAELVMSTLSGQMQALSNDWRSLLKEAGDLLAPIVRVLVIFIRHLVLGLRGLVFLTQEFLRLITFGWYRPQSELNQSAIEAARGGFTKNDGRNLKKIEENTRDIQTTLARQTLGFAGLAVRNAATIRNYRTAVGVRG